MSCSIVSRAGSRCSDERVIVNTFLLTMQYNESLCLPFFLKHYSKYFPRNNIFIIDHGSSPGITPEGYNRMYVPRDRPFSELSRMHLIKSVSSGLLQYFDAGIYVDCDELINLDALEGLDVKDSPVTYVAGFDVFWDDTPNGRRLLGYFSPHACKASIFSQIPNWSLGFHGCEYAPKTLTMPMAHIRFLFAEQSAKRLRERVLVHQAMDPAERTEGIAAQWGAGDAEFRGFYKFITERKSNAETKIREFAPIDSSRMYREHVLRSDAGIADGSFYSPNGYSPVADHLFDLTDQFPALIE
jgi:hypothetical protein